MITKTTQYCKNQKLSKAISYVTGSEFIVQKTDELGHQ